MSMDCPSGFWVRRISLSVGMTSPRLVVERTRAMKTLNPSMRQNRSDNPTVAPKTSR